MMKKLIKISFIFVTLSLFFKYSYADDYIEEDSSDLSYSESIYVSTDVNNVPTINARHAVVYDRSSGNVLYGKDELSQCKMASTTKIMTAIIVLENTNLNNVVTVSSKAANTGGSRLGLSTNDTLTVESLLYGLMLRSGNDAAVALAEYVGGSVEEFANIMNQKASELELTNTHFMTPHGLDNDNHYTNAYELAVLADYALKNDTFSKIVKTKTITIMINGYSKSLSNTNELLGYLDGVYGVKTGFTNGANRCLVTSCKRGDLDVICVVLGCDTKKDRTKDSIRLINYTFKNFVIINLSEIICSNFENWKAEHADSFFINKGDTQNLNIYINLDNIPYKSCAINSEDIENIQTKFDFESYFEAPVCSNTTVGKMDILIGDEYLFSLDILNSNTVNKKDVFDYFSNFLFSYSDYLLNNFLL